VKWLAEATKAQVRGCHVGSQEFEFRPSVPSSQILDRNIQIDTGSAANILLVFQAIFPFLLFAGDADSSPITVSIRGGTNVSFSLSYDYLDQVLLPTLELLGVPAIERTLQERGWSHGPRQVGSVKFKFTPLKPGQQLDTASWPNLTEPGSISRIDATTVVPQELRAPLKRMLELELCRAFPGTAVNFLPSGDSRHPARVYTLLVAHSTTGLRVGHDWLYDKSTKGKAADKLAADVARRVVGDLDSEVRKGGCVDEYLHDQLVVFQALANGCSSVASEVLGGSRDDSDLGRVVRGEEEPFGTGSMHTKTARWVVSQLLPGVEWRDDGQICHGVGWNASPEDGLAKLNIEN
jgi:RNA 3'-terminal phosphate cyclase (ATP)